MHNKIVFFALNAACSVAVCMDRQQLPVQPRDQLQQSVHGRLASCEGDMRQLATDTRFSNGQMQGQIDSQAKRNDAEFKRLQALITQSARESREEAAAIQVRLASHSARLSRVEDGLDRETQERINAVDQLRSDLQAEMRNRAEAIGSETQAREAADTTEKEERQADIAAMRGTQTTTLVAVAGVGVLAAVGLGFTWIYNGQTTANLELLYRAFNKGRAKNEQVEPVYK